jgi:putative peptidoglycan lipid II flippase
VENAGGPRSRSGAYALFIAAGIFLSRIAGLVRGGVLSYFLGTTGAASAFQAALRIPNFLQNLLGEGVLSASMIPVYSRLLAEKEQVTAGRVAGVIASLLALVTAVTVVAGVLFAPLFVDVLVPGYGGELRELTITLVRILFPGIGLLVLSAWCLAVLNSHRMFFIPYVAPVLWNAAIIAALLIFSWGQSVDRIAVIAAWGVAAGAVLQFGVQVPFVLRYAPRLRFSLGSIPGAVRQVFSNFVPVVIARGVVQISAFIDEILASFLGEAAISAMGIYAYPIYLLPVSLFGMSVSAAELPQMSSVTGTAEEIRAAVRERLNAALRQIAFFVVPSTIAFLSIGNFLIAALYQRNLFSTESTLYVWYILIGYSIGLVPVTLGRLYSSAFYSFNDTRTPLKFAIVRVVLTAALGAVLAFPLRPLLVRLIDFLGPLPLMADRELALGAVGLSTASGLIGWVEFSLLRRALRRRVEALPTDSGFLVKIVAAALGSGLVAVLTGRYLLEGAALHPIPLAVIVAGIFGLFYLGTTAALRIPETRKAARFLRRR